mmetsp:Transcript_29122/g.53216  ORF Transcript_29122/g.53216 Transcript_29122/m.53216 type:complete len:120 (-) Transcript_29122:375-734(-)
MKSTALLFSDINSGVAIYPTYRPRIDSWLPVSNMAMTNRSRIYNYSSTDENTESSFLTMAAALAAISSHLPSSMASSMLSISRILLLVSGKAIGEYTVDIWGMEGFRDCQLDTHISCEE